MLIDHKELERRLQSGRNLANRFGSQSNPNNASPTRVEKDPTTLSEPTQAPSPNQKAINELTTDMILEEVSHAQVAQLPSAKKEYHPQLKNTELRVVAGTLARTGTPVVEVARDLGMTPNQVQGAANSKNQEVSSRIEANLNRVREMALDKMLEAMGLMDEEKFANASLKDLASVAGNLSRIVEKTSPKESSGPAVQLVVYAPQQREVADYKVVDV